MSEIFWHATKVYFSTSILKSTSLFPNQRSPAEHLDEVVTTVQGQLHVVGEGQPGVLGDGLPALDPRCSSPGNHRHKKEDNSKRNAVKQTHVLSFETCKRILKKGKFDSAAHILFGCSQVTTFENAKKTILSLLRWSKSKVEVKNWVTLIFAPWKLPECMENFTKSHCFPHTYSSY